MLPFIVLSGCFWTKTDPSETGVGSLPNVDDLPVVDAQFETSGSITCENPEARLQAPMTLADFGEAWASQPVAGYTPLPEHVVRVHDVVLLFHHSWWSSQW